MARLNRKLHRNSQKRYYGSDKIYFIVTKTFRNFPYFKEPIFCDLLIEELRLCKELKQFELYAFCLIFDHLNLLIKPNKKYNVSKVMKSLKENTSRDINYIISNKTNVGDTSTCRLRMKEIIKDFRKKFVRKYGKNQYEIPSFKWQKSFHDHVIRNEKDFLSHYKYTVYNYKKHNLPNNWKYTSLNYNKLVDEIKI